MPLPRCPGSANVFEAPITCVGHVGSNLAFSDHKRSPHIVHESTCWFAIGKEARNGDGMTDVPQSHRGSQQLEGSIEVTGVTLSFKSGLTLIRHFVL
jgi:hypothetical protein